MDLFNSPEFASHVEDLMREWHVPGLAIAVTHNDSVVSNGYGKASLKSEKPATADTLFDIASCSKSLTAASVGLLIADNDNYPQLQWDTSVSKLLPDDFVMSSDGYTENITVEDILSHSTGLPS